jgi:hypothetical protein
VQRSAVERLKDQHVERVAQQLASACLFAFHKNLRGEGYSDSSSKSSAESKSLLSGTWNEASTYVNAAAC